MLNPSRGLNHFFYFFLFHAYNLARYPFKKRYVYFFSFPYLFSCLFADTFFMYCKILSDHGL